MSNNRFRKALYIVLLSTIIIAICIWITTNDTSLKAIIKSALFSDALTFQIKFLAVFLPVLLLFIFIRLAAPEQTKWLQSLVSFPLGLVRQKMNTKQTIVVILFGVIYYSIAIPFESQFSRFLGWLLSIIWIIALLIPLHFLRTRNQ